MFFHHYVILLICMFVCVCFCSFFLTFFVICPNLIISLLATFHLRKIDRWNPFCIMEIIISSTLHSTDGKIFSAEFDRSFWNVIFRNLAFDCVFVFV